jgi:hypothetical protein
LPCFAQAYLGLLQRRVVEEAAELPVLAGTIASWNWRQSPVDQGNFPKAGAGD